MSTANAAPGARVWLTVAKSVKLAIGKSTKKLAKSNKNKVSSFPFETWDKKDKSNKNNK